jgi:signal transduction histidine kinase
VILRCDPLRIEQVVTNLTSNAIKYSPRGGAVDLVLQRNHHEVITTVTDHGVGMTEEDSRRLFEPFRRVGLSAETAPGVGLGLYVAKRIVEAHQGRVEVESKPGQGSTFRVYLPIT